jgi:hypothetical protein
MIKYLPRFFKLKVPAKYINKRFARNVRDALEQTYAIASGQASVEDYLPNWENREVDSWCERHFGYIPKIKATAVQWETRLDDDSGVRFSTSFLTPTHAMLFRLRWL